MTHEVGSPQVAVGACAQLRRQAAGNAERPCFVPHSTQPRRDRIGSMKTVGYCPYLRTERPPELPEEPD